METKLSPASKIFRALPHSEGFVLAAQVNGEYFYHFAKTRKMLTTAFDVFAYFASHGGKEELEKKEEKN